MKVSDDINLKNSVSSFVESFGEQLMEFLDELTKDDGPEPETYPVYSDLQDTLKESFGKFQNKNKKIKIGFLDN